MDIDARKMRKCALDDRFVTEVRPGLAGERPVLASISLIATNALVPAPLSGQEVLVGLSSICRRKIHL